MTHSAFAKTCRGRLSGMFKISCMTTPQCSRRFCFFVGPNPPPAANERHTAITKYRFIAHLHGRKFFCKRCASFESVNGQTSPVAPIEKGAHVALLFRSSTFEPTKGLNCQNNSFFPQDNPRRRRGACLFTCTQLHSLFAQRLSVAKPANRENAYLLLIEFAPAT